MPELPEVEIVARRLGEALTGAEVVGVRAAGVSTMRSFDPPLESLLGLGVSAIRRRGKHLIVDFGESRCLVIHLMQAGRLQLYRRPAAMRDRTLRLVLRFGDGSELRLREYGTRQSCWAKLLRAGDLETDPSLADLGPEAWPDPPGFAGLLAYPRPLNSLIRDQRVIAGIGRSWADEILHRAALSPFRRGSDLTADQAGLLRTMTVGVLDEAVMFYEKELRLPLPDKFPLPLRVHNHAGRPCPVCATTIEAVNFDSHQICYCPHCQTGGKVLKDRRLSRLLK